MPSKPSVGSVFLDHGELERLIACGASAAVVKEWLRVKLTMPDLDSAASGDAARELLRRRYAAGEIDDEEYERHLSALTWR